MRRALLVLAAVSVVLTLVSSAAAAPARVPGFAAWDLKRDLAKASRTIFGDVQATASRSALAAKAPKSRLVECRSLLCPFGNGWYAFSKSPALRQTDVVAHTARAAAVKHHGWGVTVRLTAGGVVRWHKLDAYTAQELKAHGVPDVLVFAVAETVISAPLANTVSASGSTLGFDDMRRVDALRVAKALGGK